MQQQLTAERVEKAWLRFLLWHRCQGLAESEHGNTEKNPSAIHAPTKHKVAAAYSHSDLKSGTLMGNITTTNSNLFQLLTRLPQFPTLMAGQEMCAHVWMQMLFISVYFTHHI